FFFFSSRRRHTRFSRDWSSDVCSSDLHPERVGALGWRGAELRPGRREAPAALVDVLARPGAAVAQRDRREAAAQVLGLREAAGRSEERRVGKEGRAGWWKDR